jgi:4'-phosphopantetheinyl transferase
LTTGAEITVVRARLAGVPCDRAVLSPGECARADRLPAAAAHAFVAGRCLLRRVLGRALGVEPATVELIDVDGEKPRLAGDGDLDFNVSHGGDWVLIALARGCKVGVDVEPMYPSRDVAAISAALGIAPSATVSFAQEWARLEARCKATGRGLTIPLDPDLADDVTVRDLVLAPDHAAAVAWTGGAARLTEHDA